MVSSISWNSIRGSSQDTALYESHGLESRRSDVKRWSWLFYLDVVSKEAVYLSKFILWINASVSPHRTTKLTRKQKRSRLFKEEHQIRKTPCILYWQETLIMHVGFKAGFWYNARQMRKIPAMISDSTESQTSKQSQPKKSCQGKSATFGCAHSGVTEFVLFKGKKKKKKGSHSSLAQISGWLRFGLGEQHEENCLIREPGKKEKEDFLQSHLRGSWWKAVFQSWKDFRISHFFLDFK